MFHKSFKTYSCRVSKRYPDRWMCHCTRGTTSASESKSVEVPNPKTITTDMVGPPDPVSNLRRIVFKQSAHESVLEKVHREKRMEVQEWNQKFWTDHNSRFFKDREAYLKKNLPADKESLGADEMSVFYKAFLDKNWESHVSYNIEWYKRNFMLLGLALKVKFAKLFSKR